MYAIRLKTTNYFVRKIPRDYRLEENVGSTWVKKPDLKELWAQGPWLKTMATILNIDINDAPAMTKFAQRRGSGLFEIVEVEFTIK